MLLTRLLGAALGTGLLFLAASSTANAYDRRERERDHWRHEHWRHDHGRDHGYSRDYRRDRVVVRDRPVIVERERPVFVQPAPMYAAPMMQMPYNQGPSGLNLNFNIPLN
ncbi:MAG TPA: hypothetical protein VLA02_14300 [Reyranella sp.]|nr:hypothetical protein [Reyranella sp.]